MAHDRLHAAEHAPAGVDPLTQVIRRFQTGASRYYLAEGCGGANSNLVLVLNQLYLMPFEVGMSITATGIVTQVTVASSGGSGGVLRYGLYASDSTGAAGVLLAEGTVSSESTGMKEVTISAALTPGLHWLGVVAQVETCTVKGGAIGAGTGRYIRMAQSNDGESIVQTIPSISGALPNPSGVAATITQRAPVTKLKVG